ncbi:MAG: hypothetical protein M1812_003694 [Candelaria pacifica]|nr:MAG: hypothetical protein M1812_003694 [Candelaria pacifica]
MTFSTLLSLVILYLACQVFALSQHQPYRPYKQYRPINATSWGGWRSVSYLFTFGDSYTTTGFDPKGVLPSSGNPFGNPLYPGLTSSIGPNWVDFLTTTYNQSLIQTYNFAYGGATVDRALVPGFGPSIKSLKDQIQEEFLPTFTIGMPASAPWRADNSLFALLIGINDVNLNPNRMNITLNAAIFRVYRNLIEQMYGNGARRFLFLNVPPIDRSPGTKRGPMNATLQAINIADFNSKLVDMGNDLVRYHGDAIVFQFDLNKVFTRSLDNVSFYPQTAGIKEISNDCAAYDSKTPSSFYPNCSIPVNEYFWLNDLHPTFPVHNASAAEIVKFLG